MKTNIQQASELIRGSKYCTAFTGAGISVESGIPPFRGEDGLWSKYDPDVLDIHFFKKNPERSWEVIMEIFYDFFGHAKPNAAHYGLARLEEKGILKSVITQNIDNLHQEAGSKVVWEYHGNYSYLVCPMCGKKTRADMELLKSIPPRCSKDNSVLKPDFVFFGEGIPKEVSNAAFEDASRSDVLIVVGSTGEVMPANMIPRIAKQNGASIIEINISHSNFTFSLTDIFLKGKASEIISELVEHSIQ